MLDEVESLRNVLLATGEHDFAAAIAKALAGSAESLQAFLVSDDLWGGAGSIADQAGSASGRELRRGIEAALVRLGRRQIREGVINARTEMWTKTFEHWSDKGI